MSEVMKASVLPFLVLGVICGSPAAAEPLTFNCSAPIGRDSAIWRFRTAGPPFRIRGSVAAHRLDPIPPDAPQLEGEFVMTDRTAEVTVIDFGGNTTELSFRADRDDRTVQVGVTISNGNRYDGMEIETRARGTGAWIPFELSFEATRALVRIGSREVSLDVALTAGGRTQIMVGCRGGEFWFRDLEISG